MRDPAPNPSPAETALVTGASAGIGEALARRLAHEGFALVLVARRQARLDELAAALKVEYGVRVDAVACDLAHAGAAAELAATLARKRRRIDLLVNNAGVLEQNPFVETPVSRQRELVDLNVGAVVEMLAAFVPAMLDRGHGRVLNVASIAAFQPLPGLATYAATKAFVLSLTEALAEELRGSGVSATALCPGITATSMLETAAARNPRLSRLPPALVGDADAVAAEGVRACLAGEVVCVPGWINRATTLAAGATPRGLLRRIAGLVGRATL
ncbi:short-chain dehydrogenase [Rubrivivax gelatinosus]|uniref:SDR family NAD(P)-dependent oxidoreductase n=1 Tax=Rubrivivax gelatinosus TaxID=28068 RepID=UPI0019035C13|nr:SDR family oxidoreductase [Rubrivivax gelatinosus]MBK1615158.1 short-chain dehydrogenase [Rubrivivax gelatinosus]